MTLLPLSRMLDAKEKECSFTVSKESADQPLCALLI